MAEDKKIKSRNEKITEWFKNPYNLVLIGIIILSIVIRIYYYTQTNQQALWWDEAEYMATAKKWAFDVPYDLNPQRPPIFQFLAALAFMIGLGENFIRLFLVVLPSVILVYAVYLLGKEMYDKKIGLVAAFFTAVSWTFVFWTNRVQPDFISMVFSVLAILFMWKFWKGEGTKWVVLSGVFAAIGFMFKVSGLLVPLIFLVFIILKDRLEMFKIKEYYYFAIAFIVSMIPQFIWSYVTFGNVFAFSAGYSNEVVNHVPFGWYNIKFYYFLTQGATFLLFIIGLVLALKFILFIDILAKDKKRVFDSDLFGVLSLVIISAFYIFYIRGTDDRWVFLWMPFIFLMIGKTSLFLHGLLKKLNKILAVIIILAILLFAGYTQVAYAANVAQSKTDSYLPVKLAGIWLKEHSNPEDRVFSISYTQTTYYSEREVFTISDEIEKDTNTTRFNEFLEKVKPRFIQVSIFEPHPAFISQWVQENAYRLNVVQAYFSDSEQKNAVLVIYEFKYS